MSELSSRIARLEERTAHMDERLRAFERRLWALGLVVATLANAVDIVTALTP